MAFNRVIEISMGPPGSVGINVRNLRMTFQIDKSDSETTNKAVIAIYNLSNDSATRYGKVGNKIIVRAGYSDDGAPRSIFFGDISRAVYRKEGTEKILDIEADDGKNAKIDNVISIGYAAGTPVVQVINDIIQSIGIPLAAPFEIPINTYNNGYSFIGRAADGLTETLALIGKEWSIQNEQLIIYSPGEIVTRTGLLLSPESGLLHTPEVLEDDNKTNVKKYRIVFLLDGRILPGSEIRLRSAAASGNFRVESVTLTGDNYGGDFIGTAEVEEV